MNEPLQAIPEKNRDLSARIRLFAIGLIMLGFAIIMTGVWLISFLAPLFLVMTLFVISIIMLVTATSLLQISPNITFALIGLGLACVSFAYQPSGPEIGQYGTEC